MKTVMLMIAAILTTGSAMSQKIKEAEVPSAVKSAFAKKYPGAKVEEWEKENTDYEAEFDLKKVESSAVFSADGAFKELEQEIKIAELPKTVTDYCTKNYAAYKLSEASKITDASGKVMYEAELKKGKEQFDLIFDDKGGFIKKETETEKDDDDDKKK
jgi:Putative beta-lactamase-inhibitor-like, PepSY-like